jgi:alkanesulfonate monooxygenase SsuD/methylene tetrahydromethanopterin reductase-like flavin-dependent oxidoreductase (luciferase family)
MSVSVLVPTTGQWSEVVGYAKLADELGCESINCSHISARDSFRTLAALASVAPNVRLATAVAPNYRRSPASMAQTAATVDDLAAARFRLGLGAGYRIMLAQWHGAELGRPLAERPTRCRAWTTRAIGPAAAVCPNLRIPSGAR